MIEREKEAIASLPKTYEPQAVEAKWYRFWEEGGYFKPSGDITKPTFVTARVARPLSHRMGETSEVFRQAFFIFCSQRFPVRPQAIFHREVGKV